MNNKNRKFKNEKYLNYIRQMPCAITGKAGDNIHPHHADVIGRQGVRNDYYTLPLRYNRHLTGRGHITAAQLEKDIGEDPRDLIIFYLSMYIEFSENNYNPGMDREVNFLTFRRKLIGKE